MKKQTKKDKLDEKLSMKHGKEGTKKQSMADRRHESKGASCKMGMKEKMGSKKR